MSTYTISPDGQAITCGQCGRTSYHPGDVRERYCEHCKIFHEFDNLLREVLAEASTGLDPRLQSDVLARLQATLKPQVLGEIEPDLIGTVLGTAYHRFKSPSGVGGLAKWDAMRLDLLVVHTEKPGTGQFSQFMHLAKLAYQTICVWEIYSPHLARILERAGFAQVCERDPHTGEIIEGYRWDIPFVCK